MNHIYFVCCTVYQLFVALYYASKLSKNCLKVLIWTDATQGVNTDSFAFVFDKIFLIESECNKPLIEKYWIRISRSGYFSHLYYRKKIFSNLNKNDVLLYFSEFDSSTCKLIKQFSRVSKKIILTEEGIGTYSCDKRIIPFNETLSIIIFGIESCTQIGNNKNIMAYIVKNPELLPFEKHKGRRIIQQNTMFNDNEWIKSLRIFNDRIRLELEKFSRKRVLWLGQPLDSLGTDINTEIEISNRIIRMFKEPYCTIIKKHPRDKVEKYKYITNKNVCKYFVDHETWVPAEILAGEIDPEIIITPISSAALNLYELRYGKKVIFCYKLFGIEVDDSWLDKYKDNEDVYNVESFDELRSVIEEIGSNPVRINNEDMTVNENKDIDYLNNLLKEVYDE